MWLPVASITIAVKEKDSLTTPASCATEPMSAYFPTSPHSINSTCLLSKSPTHLPHPAPIKIEGTKSPEEMDIPYVQQASIQYRMVNITSVSMLNSDTLS